MNREINFVELSEFVNKDSDNAYGEYIHVKFDRKNAELTITRSLDYDDPILAVKFTARIRTGTYDKNDEFWTAPDSLYITGGMADNIMTWLRALLRERSDVVISASYYDKNNCGAYEDAGINNETLRLTYKTSSGITHVCHLDNVYTKTEHKW